MDKDLLDRFCAPPSPPLTDFDARVLSDASPLELSFEGRVLAGYAWGEGEPVLLVHGWGSRASHIALLGRSLARSGFRAAAFDMPAHSSKREMPGARSNMFEYCRAVGAMTAAISPFAIVGHSFGGMCALFAASGFGAFSSLRAEVARIALVSSPPTLRSVLESFCRRDEPRPADYRELKDSLERGFDFSVDDYALERALPLYRGEALFAHDADDAEFPIAEIRALSSTAGARLVETSGLGHERILAGRAVAAEIAAFLRG